jgi:hypothetical protein
MLPLQCCELLLEGQGLEEEPATSAEEPKNRAYNESDSVYHASVLPYFDGERQRCILLKSQADVIFGERQHDVRLRHPHFASNSV